jgi:FAD/FMN-containing dehydrogenase
MGIAVDLLLVLQVKGGGHSSNVGFSSTTGVMISMAKFDQITLNKRSNTVKLGPGATWDQAYTKLEALNLTVIGGRIPGVGKVSFRW